MSRSLKLLEPSPTGDEAEHFEASLHSKGAGQNDVVAQTVNRGNWRLENASGRAVRPVLVMPVTQEAAMRFGRRRHRINLIAALMTGIALVAVLGPSHGFGNYWMGLLIGLVYANGFEYVYHRWVLHTHGRMTARHGEHHAHWCQPDEPAHVSFGSSWLWVAGVITANSVPFLAADRIWGWALAPGITASFALYFILMEDFHWRIHVGELPRFLRWCRRHHLRHHAKESAGFNVFLPLFDLLLATWR